MLAHGVGHSCSSPRCDEVLTGPWDYCKAHRPSSRDREPAAVVRCPSCREFVIRWREVRRERGRPLRALTYDDMWQYLDVVAHYLDHVHGNRGNWECGRPLPWVARAVKVADRELTRSWGGYFRARREAATRVLAELLGITQRTVRRRLDISSEQKRVDRWSLCFAASRPGMKPRKIQSPDPY